MDKLKEFRDECAGLRDRYFELKPRGIRVETIEDARESERNSVEATKLIRDFYKGVFIAKYSNCLGEVFSYVDNALHGLAHLADEALKEENYFGMNVLLLPWGFRKEGPDKLEKLIGKLDEELGRKGV